MEIVNDPKKLLTTVLNVVTKLRNNYNVESKSALTKVENAALGVCRRNYLSIYFFIKYLTYVI